MRTFCLAMSGLAAITQVATLASGGTIYEALTYGSLMLGWWALSRTYREKPCMPTAP